VQKSKTDDFQKTTLMLVLIAGLLIVHKVIAVVSYSPLRERYSWLRIPIAQLFGSINNSANFIIYSAFGKTVKESVKTLSVFCKESRKVIHTMKLSSSQPLKA